MVWKMIFPFQGCILRFHVNLLGCMCLSWQLSITKTQLSFFVSSLTPCKTCSPVAKIVGSILKVFGLAARVGCGPLDARKTGRRFPTPTKPVEISLTKQGDYMFNKAPTGENRISPDGSRGFLSIHLIEDKISIKFFRLEILFFQGGFG